LADFGIAKASTREAHTMTGLVKGKIGYMSPEQVRGERLTRRADVWAAGVVAWEILANQRLYGSDTDIATALQIVNESPPRLRAVAPDVSRDLEEAVMGALTPDVEQRVPTAALFAKALLWAVGREIAERDEVAAYVSRAAEVRLRKRRAE